LPPSSGLSLQTLSRASQPRARETHPQLSPWPSFSLVAAAARSHTPRTPRFSTKLSRRASGHANLPLLLYHRHHYYCRHHHHQRRRSYYHYSTPVAITFGASTFTSSNPTMCCLRRVSAELPSSFQIQPPPSPPLPFFSFHSDSPLRPRSACHPFHRIYPARFLLRFSFKFYPTFSTRPPPLEPTTMLPRHTPYISRARGSFYPLAIPSLYLFLSLTLSYAGDAHY